MRPFLRHLTLLCAALLALPSSAQDTASPAATATAPSADAATPEAATPPPPVEAAEAESRAFEAFVDGTVGSLLARERYAGLTLSVVRGDRVLLAKGYGLAALDPQRPVDAERTLFRIGSISKTFTYVAAMQLVAAGRMTLDDPVNERLPPALAVPDDGFDEPIRLRHLLTHTAGFEDTVLGHLFVREASKVLSPEEYLVRHRPRRVRAPGTVAVYSNYSVALLGAVIAHVSGQPYIDYIEQQLTGPLGMAHATFREPLPAGDPRALDADRVAELAVGTTYVDGAFEARPFEFLGHGSPAGGMSASATAMARWMRMLLAGGTLDGVRVLPADTALALREVLFRNADGAPGVAHGFLTQTLGPHEAFGHGGATLYFHSGMLLVPALDLGVFVSCNSAESRSAVAELVLALVARLAPETRTPPVVQALDPASLARYAGTYRSNRRAYSTVEKAFLGLGNDIEVRAAADGSLRVTGGGETTRYLPVGPGVFQSDRGPSRMAFLGDALGVPDRFVSGHAVAVNERVGTLDRGDVLLLALVLAGVVAIARAVRAFRPRPKRPAHDPRPGLGAVKLLSGVSTLAWLAALGGLAVAFAGMGAEGSDVVFTYPSTTLRLALWLTVAAALATTAELFALPVVWRGGWRLWPRLRYTLAVAILAFAVALLCRWNLVAVGF